MDRLNIQGCYAVPDSSDRPHCQTLKVRFMRDETVANISRKTSVDSNFMKLNKNHESAKVSKDDSKYSFAFEDPLIRTFGSGQAVANSSAFGSMDVNNFQISRSLDSMSDLIVDNESQQMSRKSVTALTRRCSLSTPHLANYSSESFRYPSLPQEKMKATSGVVMALAVAALGISTAAKKGGLLANRTQTPTKLCVRCYGSGVERCDICNGRGRIEWEGKFKHVDPCPLCYGSRTRKCTACDGKHRRKTSLLSSRRQ